MTDVARRVRVIDSCAREHIQDIRIREGESCSVGHRNQQHPAYVWCACEDGHHGWVPEEYLEYVGPRDAVARRDYDSAHLTVVAGEELEALEEAGDFVLCRNAAGVQGWVPASCVAALEQGP